MQQEEQNLDGLALAVRENPTDSAAFSRLHAAFSLWIRKKAESYLAPGDGRADEIRNEMTVALLDAARTFDPEKGAFRAYAARCMSNRAIDYFKKNRKEDPVDPTSEAFLQIASDEDIEADLTGREAFGELLSRARSFLSPFEYSVLELMSAGFSNPEIAERLSVPKKSVENAKNRIKTKTRENGIGL